jgi:DNA-binding transcriptional regulator PaaX
MKPTPDELLSFVLSCIHLLTHPTAQLLIPSRSAWDREDQWRPRLRYLRKRGWIESTPTAGHFPYLVTPAGRQQALGNLNPESWWNRSWDGRWLAFSFDLPVTMRACRARLLRWLHAQRFGLLQRSLWIRPDLPTPPFPPVRDLPAEVDSLIVLEARCHRGFTNAQIVDAAWDFNAINDHYRFYLDLLHDPSRECLLCKPNPRKAIAWLRQERSAWIKASRLDPFLPRSLWPPGYLGHKAWHARRQFLGL